MEVRQADTLSANSRSFVSNTLTGRSGFARATGCNAVDLAPEFAHAIVENGRTFGAPIPDQGTWVHCTTRVADGPLASLATPR